MYCCPRCHTRLEHVHDGKAEYEICPTCNFLEVIDFQRKGIILKVLGETEASNAGERPAQG